MATNYAQSIEFAPEGSVWEYRRQAGGWGPPVIDYVKVRYIDNILVDSILCKRLTAPEGDYYVYQVGDRVYHRRDTATQFKLLWDFGVMPGDTFTVYSSSEYTPEKEIKVACTGRDTILENNVPLPRIDLTFLCSGWSYSITVNPRYGPMYKTYCPDYLFNTYNYCVIDAGYGFTLLNYSDTEFPSVINCPNIVVDSGYVAQLTVFPSPTTGMVYLNNLPDGADFECYDIVGRLVTVPRDTVRDSIDLSDAPAGIYIVYIRMNDRTIRKVKVSKI